MTHLSIKSFDKIVISHMMLITSENSMFKLKQNHHLLDLNISCSFVYISLFISFFLTFVRKWDLASFLVVLVPLSVHCSGFKVPRQCQPSARQRQRDLTMLPRMPWHCWRPGRLCVCVCVCVCVCLCMHVCV